MRKPNLKAWQTPELLNIEGFSTHNTGLASWYLTNTRSRRSFILSYAVNIARQVMK